VFVVTRNFGFDLKLRIRLGGKGHWKGFYTSRINPLPVVLSNVLFTASTWSASKGAIASVKARSLVPNPYVFEYNQYQRIKPSELIAYFHSFPGGFCNLMSIESREWSRRGRMGRWRRDGDSKVHWCIVLCVLRRPTIGRSLAIRRLNVGGGRSCGRDVSSRRNSR